MLYIVNKSSVTANALSLIKDEDVVLLIEDGVYTACSPGVALAKPGKKHALKPDVVARGLLGKISPDIKLISYEEFVDLTVQHYPVVNF